MPGDENFVDVLSQNENILHLWLETGQGWLMLSSIEATLR